MSDRRATALTAWSFDSVVKTAFVNMAWMTCAVILCALLTAPAGDAQTLDAEEHMRGKLMAWARAAFAEGRFLDAAKLGMAHGTSDGHALAAQAMALHGFVSASDEDKPAVFREAVELAQEAIRLDPGNPEAHIQLAHARGRYAQTLGFLQAVAGGYATKVRESVDEALRLDPDKAAGHLSLATWHAEIVHAAGSMAGVLYGATEKEARRHYARALELKPDAKVVCVEYAYGLLLLDEEGNREEARRLLERAVEIPSADAVDRLYHERAVTRLAILNGG